MTSISDAQFSAVAPDRTVVAVVSTFRPDASVAAGILANGRQCDAVIVIDDGSPDSSALDTLLKQPNVTVVRLAENSGIAAALNAGIRLALDADADVVVTLDQDSLLDPGYVARAVDAFNRSTPATRLGIVVPHSVNHQPALPPKISTEGFGLVTEGIQSGMVISRACIEDVGLLDERLFIDCVDTEICLRSWDRGWAVAVIPGMNITHSLGTLVPLKPLGIPLRRGGRYVTFQYHAPFRTYYITRNTIDLVLRNVVRRPRWVVAALRREIGPSFKTMFGGPNACQQWLASIIGTFHGLIRRRGKIPNWLARAVRET